MQRRAPMEDAYDERRHLLEKQKTVMDERRHELAKENVKKPFRERYVHTLQCFNDHTLVAMSTWSFRTIRDLRSVTRFPNVLSFFDRFIILVRGIFAMMLWLPINLVAIPYLVLLMKLHESGHLEGMAQLHEIIPGLYLGTERAAREKQILEKYGISRVLSVVDFELATPAAAHKRVQIEDFPDVELKLTLLEELLAFVKEGLDKGEKVLVHCQMGQSRSATVMVYVVHKIMKVSTEDALKLVTNRRPVVSINYGFRRQLRRLKVVI